MQGQNALSGLAPPSPPPDLWAPTDLALTKHPPLPSAELPSPCHVCGHPLDRPVVGQLLQREEANLF